MLKFYAKILFNKYNLFNKKQINICLIIYIILDQTRKSTAIKGTAVRENSVSRHPGGPNRTPLKSSVHHSTIVLWGLGRILTWASIMPRDASLTDSVCERFQSGLKVNFS